MKRTLLVVVLAFGACKTGPQVVDEVPPPTVAQEDFTVVNQSLTQCDVKYGGTIAAGGAAISVKKAHWEFVVDGVVMRSGDVGLNLSAAAGATADFSLQESLTYVKDEDDLKAMDTRGGSLLLALRGTLVVVVEATGAVPSSTLELPFAKSREVRTPRLPHLKLIEFEAGRFSDVEVQATFHLGVVNPNPFQISLAGIDYGVKLGAKEVSKGTIGAGERVSAASTGVFDVTATLNEETHGNGAAKIVKSLVVPYELKASLRAALYTETIDGQGSIKLKPNK
jgi:LEA14-like dessication related protein